MNENEYETLNETTISIRRVNLQPLERVNVRGQFANNENFYVILISVSLTLKFNYKQISRIY